MIINDLKNLFSTVYCFDVQTKREEGTTINVDVNVSRGNLELWQSLRTNIEQLINYVTAADSDNWRVNFCPIDGMDILDIPKHTGTSNVSLLSGGLDSYCGVHKNISEGESPIYCGYKTNNLDTNRINSVLKFADKAFYPQRRQLFRSIHGAKKYPYQRTRSLLFFSLACCLAVYEGISSVKIFENGIMSLNPSFQSRGTTRTTHPKTIMLYQRILQTLGINVQLESPFVFLTKGQMVNGLSDEFKNNIALTRSCSKPPVAFGTPGKHSCGECVPCLLRKISLAAYDLERYDHSNSYKVPYEGADSIEYASSLQYFKSFYASIRNEEIFTQLDIRSKYYDDTEYLEKTGGMLKCFADEMEVFFQKYAE